MCFRPSWEWANYIVLPENGYFSRLSQSTVRACGYHTPLPLGDAFWDVFRVFSEGFLALSSSFFAFFWKMASNSPPLSHNDCTFCPAINMFDYEFVLVVVLVTFARVFCQVPWLPPAELLALRKR